MVSKRAVKAQTTAKGSDIALRQDHARFGDLMDVSRDAYWELDEHLRCTLVVGATLPSWAADPKSYLGATYWDHGRVPLADGGNWQRHKAVLRARQPFTDVRLKSPMATGEMQYISISGQPVFDDKNRFVGYRGVARDISQHVQLELRLVIEHAVTRLLESSISLAEVTPQIIRVVCDALDWACGARWEFDEAAQALRNAQTWGSAAPGIEEFLEVTRQQTPSTKRGGLNRRAWAEARPVWILDVTREEGFRRAAAALKAGLRTAFAFPIKIDTRVVGVFEFFSRAIHQPDTDLLECATNIGSQIGQFVQRTRAEEEQRHLRDRLQSLLALSSDWFWEQDAAYRFTMHSPYYLAPYEFDQLIGKPRWDLPVKLTPEQWACHRADLDARRDFKLRYALDTKVGEHWFEIQGQPIFDTDGNFAGYRGVGRNITRDVAREAELANHRERLEDLVAERTAQLAIAKDAAESANRTKSAFLASMSHEIRTPLTPIIGFAETLLQDDLDTDTREKLLNAIIRNGRHLFNIINEILDLSKIEADKLEVEKVDVDISQVYQDINSVIGTLARDKGLEYHHGFVNPVPRRIQSDPTRFKQILMNLLTNAVKFTERGQVGLTCELESERKLLHFTVSDTGIGVPQDKVGRLFKPFSQVDDSTTRRYGGTGLGLYISQRLAHLLGGDIAVTSEEGRGSRFTVTLPVENADMSRLITTADLSDTVASYATGLPTRIPQLSGHVLLAEDSPDNQRLISHFIGKTGARVSLAENGQIALEMAMANDYDLVLMDMQMPVMGGSEAVELLRACGCQTPVVALTANAMKGDLDTYTRVGCNGFLGKPIRQHVFYDVLAKYLPKATNRPSGGSAAPGMEEDKEFLELQKRFVQSLDGYIVKLNDALAGEDFPEMREQAHQLKGLGGSFDFPDITECAGELHAALRTEPHVNIPELVGRLSALLKQLTLSRSTTD